MSNKQNDIYEETKKEAQEEMLEDIIAWAENNTEYGSTTESTVIDFNKLINFLNKIK